MVYGKKIFYKLNFKEKKGLSQIGKTRKPKRKQKKRHKLITKRRIKAIKAKKMKKIFCFTWKGFSVFSILLLDFQIFSTPFQ